MGIRYRLVIVRTAYPITLMKLGYPLALCPRWQSVFQVLLISCLLIFLPSRANAENIPAQILHKNAGNDDYITTLLSQALRGSAYGESQLSGYPEKLTKKRLVEEAEADRINVFWSASNSDLESRFLPIRIPLYKGLFGHRIFLIRKDQQSKFDPVENLQQLAQLDAGLGTFWEDTRILKAAKLKVETATQYNNLFPMLEGGRFDYFPRGLHEPWNELNKPGREPLTVEQNLMLVYPMPVYFFVNRQRPALAEAISQGLWHLIDNGQFDQLFNTNPLVIKAITRATPGQRRILRIDNRNLPSATPLADKRLWFDPKRSVSITR